MGFFSKFFLANFVLFHLFVLSTAFAVIDPVSHSNDGCGGEVVKRSIIIPNGKFELRLDATQELQFRQAQIASSKSLIQKNHEQFAKVFGWYVSYLHGFRKMMGTVEGDEVDMESASIEAGNAAMNEAIQKELGKLRADKRDEFILTYFGAHYPGLTGQRIKNLVNAFLIQEYLARFDARMIERLALQVPIDQNLYSAPRDLIQTIMNEVLQELARPNEEFPHLAKIPRGLPVRTYGISVADASLVEEAYLRADRLALETALAKGAAMSLDASVPEAAREFMKSQQLALGAGFKTQAHPILIDWVNQLEQFVSPQ